MIYGAGWTGERVLERVIAALTEVVRPRNSKSSHLVITVGEDGKLTGPVDGLDIVRLAEQALGKGSNLHAHFSLWVWAQAKGEPIGELLRQRGWSSSDHDRKRRQAADAIASWINERRVLDGGKTGCSASGHGRTRLLVFPAKDSA